MTQSEAIPDTDKELLDTAVAQQVAEPPALVNVSANPGDADSLTVAFDAPLSDGGATITHYRVELDPGTWLVPEVFRSGDLVGSGSLQTAT